MPFVSGTVESHSSPIAAAKSAAESGVTGSAMKIAMTIARAT